MRADAHDVEVFFDGDCPLCMREIRLLRRLDGGRGKILFTNIAPPDFDPADHALAATRAQLMARIHARLPGGRLIEGVEVFRRLYAAVGFGPLVRLSRLPGISHVLDAGYRWFARNRLSLTGRCTTDSCAVGSASSAVR